MQNILPLTRALIADELISQSEMNTATIAHVISKIVLYSLQSILFATALVELQ